MQQPPNDNQPSYVSTAPPSPPPPPYTQYPPPPPQGYPSYPPPLMQPPKPKPKRRLWLWIIGIIVVLIVIVSFASRGGTTTTTTTTPAATQAPAGNTPAATQAPAVTPTPTPQSIHYPPTTEADLRGLAAKGDASAIHGFHSESVGLVGVCPQPKLEVTVDPSVTGQQLAEDLLAYFYGQQLDSPCGYHIKCCVMVHSRKARKSGLNWV